MLDPPNLCCSSRHCYFDYYYLGYCHSWEQTCSAVHIPLVLPPTAAAAAAVAVVVAVAATKDADKEVLHRAVVARHDDENALEIAVTKIVMLTTRTVIALGLLPFFAEKMGSPRQSNWETLCPFWISLLE